MSPLGSVSSKPFKIGFIGAGGIAMHHMKLLKGIPGVQMLAASDISEKALGKARDQHGIDRLYTDYKKMLKEVPELDAVSICTPTTLHAENATYALEQGKHVLVEKPMALTARDAQRMADLSRRLGKQLIVGFQTRFEPKSKMIHDQIAGGAFGRILYVRAQALRRRGIPSWGVFGKKELAGGGPLMELGVHIIETAHYLIGAPRPVTATGGIYRYLGNKPLNVAAPWGPWDHNAHNVEDLAVGTVRFDGGALMTVETSYASHIEKDVMNITIMGEKGGASWDSSQIFLDHGGYMMNMSAAHIGHWDSFEYKMRHFVEVCRDDRPSEIPPEHGVMVQKMLDGIYASAEQGREVVIE